MDLEELEERVKTISLFAFAQAFCLEKQARLCIYIVWVCVCVFVVVCIFRLRVCTFALAFAT